MPFLTLKTFKSLCNLPNIKKNLKLKVFTFTQLNVLKTANNNVLYDLLNNIYLTSFL